MKKKRKRHYDKLARACVDEFFFMLCDEGAGGWMGGREVLYHRRGDKTAEGLFSSCFFRSGNEEARKTKPRVVAVVVVHIWMDGWMSPTLRYLPTYLPI